MVGRRINSVENSIFPWGPLFRVGTRTSFCLFRDIAEMSSSLKIAMFLTNYLLQKVFWCFGGLYLNN